MSIYMLCVIYISYGFIFAELFHFLAPPQVFGVRTRRGIFSLLFLFSWPQLVLDWMRWDVNSHIFFDIKLPYCFPLPSSNTSQGVENRKAEMYFFFRNPFLMTSVGVVSDASECIFSYIFLYKIVLMISTCSTFQMLRIGTLRGIFSQFLFWRHWLV